MMLVQRLGIPARTAAVLARLAPCARGCDDPAAQTASLHVMRCLRRRGQTRAKPGLSLRYPVELGDPPARQPAGPT